VVEAYRDGAGKPLHRTVINLGRDLPSAHPDLDKPGASYAVQGAAAPDSVTRGDAPLLTAALTREGTGPVALRIHVLR